MKTGEALPKFSALRPGLVSTLASGAFASDEPGSGRSYARIFGSSHLCAGLSVRERGRCGAASMLTKSAGALGWRARMCRLFRYRRTNGSCSGGLHQFLRGRRSFRLCTVGLPALLVTWVLIGASDRRLPCGIGNYLALPIIFVLPQYFEEIYRDCVLHTACVDRDGRWRAGNDAEGTDGLRQYFRRQLWLNVVRGGCFLVPAWIWSHIFSQARVEIALVSG